MKKSIALILALMLALSVAGCAAPAAAPAAEAAADDGIVIGFCNYSESMDFFVTVKASMERACQAAGIKMLYGVSEQDPQKMRQNWDLFVNQGADMIVDFSILADAGSSLATQYKKDGGIPVLSIDNVYENAYFFGVNNQGAGETAGKYLAEKIKADWDGKVDSMLQFYLESNGPVVKLRNSGIYDALTAEGIALTEDKVTWVNASGSSASGYDPSVMKSLVLDYLTAHPDDRHIAIACFNDDGANAAFSAVKAAGREADVMIISHNADPVAVDNMKLPEANCWIGTVCYSPDTYGDQVIALVQKILAGEEVPIENYANTFVVDHATASEYFPD